jgi:spore coat protein U-like protein
VRFNLTQQGAKMKKFLVSSAAATLFATALSAQAAAIAPTFNVTATLTSVCTAAAIPDVAFGTYVAFQAAAQTAAPSSFDITCTRGLAAPTFSFDGGTGYGVLAGLNYLVSASSAVTTSGNAATAVAGGIGTADIHTITISGSMPALQAGTASAGVQTATRTLTITY